MSKLWLETSARSFKQDTETWVLNEYVKASSVFFSFLEFNQLSSPQAQRIDEIIRKECKVERISVFVDASFFTINIWGPMYWRFFHYMSILLQDLSYKKIINNTELVIRLLWDLDKILPCPMCIGHYREAKSDEVKFPMIQNAFHKIAYGFIIAGIYDFHNIINLNINKSRCSRSDFINLYRCDVLSYVTVSFEYCRVPIYWFPPTFLVLVQIISLALNKHPFEIYNNLSVHLPLPKDQQTSEIDFDAVDKYVSENKDHAFIQHQTSIMQRYYPFLSSPSTSHLEPNNQQANLDLVKNAL
jgi:hypothetical protein